MPPPLCRLYLITPPRLDDLAGFGRQLAQALDGGDVAALQIRLKDVGDDIIAAATDVILPIAQARGTAVIMNDRPDLAARLGCDGVHVGQSDASYAEARRAMGPDRMVGVTCHDSLHLAMEAAEQGADYVAFGAFFPTSTKDASTRADVELLRGWQSDMVVPCVAIGGITVETAAGLATAGADFLAVSAGVWAHADGPGAAVAAFNAAMAQGVALRPSLPWQRPATRFRALMSTQSALLKVMSDAARKAARGLNRDFGELAELQVAKKAPADFVSAADLKAEETIFEMLQKARPGYSFLGEERGLVEGSDKTHTWIVDPLDGTTNFLHAIPHFAINIALQREGLIVAAVTFNPITNELFWAEKGKGCFVNDKRLRVAARTRLDESVLATGIPFLGHGQHARFLKELHQVSQRVAGVRRFGSAALDLAWVAAGRYDGFWERDLSLWDLAAGILLVTEAGGKVTDADGGAEVLTTGSICAGNLEIHPQIIERLKAAQ